MLIPRPKAPRQDPFPATALMAAVLPLVVSLPAATTMLGARFAAATDVVLMTAGLALIACTGALAARSAAARAERARRDEAVLDALEPLAGPRR
ncbi:hypothetical protein [Streptomyces sp. NPDC058874]|uniref:hypothetical protein n=1 Tax=unclassified Streptomyces TaxID=2593676 RepID=UPI00367813A5